MITDQFVYEMLYNSNEVSYRQALRKELQTEKNRRYNINNRKAPDGKVRVKITICVPYYTCCKQIC
jgi:hypothetical protein